MPGEDLLVELEQGVVGEIVVVPTGDLVGLGVLPDAA